MTITYRSIEIGELEQFARAQATSFGYAYRPEALEHRAAIFEPERSTVAFDGERLVGTSGIFTFDMTVPGAVMPVAGVTMVSVQPTDRRRGILTGMMDAQLRGIIDRDEAVAALWASEAPIYERFGYGPASQNMDFTIERVRAVIRHDIPSPGSVRLVSPTEAAAVLPPIYDRTRAHVPGFYSHVPAWWEHRILQDPEWARAGASEHRYAVYGEDGADRGYVIYRTKPDWTDWVANGTLTIITLIAETPAAYAALWRFIFGVDLVGTIEAHERSIDEPLYWMLEDPRRMTRKLHDALWIRLLDVPRALSARRYTAPGKVVIEVRDPFLGVAAGRFALEADGGGALCTATNNEPDVRLGVAELGSLFMGAFSLQGLVASGRAQVCTPQAIAKVDAMFRWPVAPWCPEVF